MDDAEHCFGISSQCLTLFPVSVSSATWGQCPHERKSTSSDYFLSRSDSSLPLASHSLEELKFSSSQPTLSHRVCLTQTGADLRRDFASCCACNFLRFVRPSGEGQFAAAPSVHTPNGSEGAATRKSPLGRLKAKGLLSKLLHTSAPSDCTFCIRSVYKFVYDFLA